jgi:hypothetical protein
MGRILVTAAVVTLLAAAVLWLMVHHIPRWYQPAYVEESRLGRVRADAVSTYNRIGDAIARRKLFTLTIEDRRVSEWIAARERIWPGSGEWVPQWMPEPMVRFREGRIVVGARIDMEGHQFVAGAHLSVELGRDEILKLRLDRLTAGSLPLPVGVLARPMARLLRMEGQDLDYLPLPVAAVAQYFRESEPAKALSEGVRRANRFVWENGRRPFRIDAIQVRDGEIALTIEPL